MIAPNLNKRIDLAMKINFLVNNHAATEHAVDPTVSVNRESHLIDAKGIAGANDLQHHLLEAEVVHRDVKIAVASTSSS